MQAQYSTNSKIHKSNIKMLLLLSGVFFINISFAQDIELLSGYAGPDANISLSGPYLLDETQYWIARIDSKDHVLTEDQVIKDPILYHDIILTEEIYQRIPIGISVFSLGSGIQIKFSEISGAGIKTVSDYILPWAYSQINILIRPSALVLPKEFTDIAGDFILFSKDALQFQLISTQQSINMYQGLKRGNHLLQDLKDTKDAGYAKDYLSSNQDQISKAQEYLQYQEGTKDELLERYNLLSARSSWILDRPIALIPEFPGSSEMNIKMNAAKSKELNAIIENSVKARIEENGTV